MQRATALVALPCMGLILFPEKLRTLMLPATAGDAEGLLEDMLAYMLGGLRSLGETAGRMFGILEGAGETFWRKFPRPSKPPPLPSKTFPLIESLFAAFPAAESLAAFG